MKTLLFTVGAALLAASACSAAPRVAEFVAKNELTVHVPAGAHLVRIWFALPQETHEQRISDLHVDCPIAHHTVHDTTEGNRQLYAEEIRPTAGDIHIVTTFRVRRWEAVASTDPARTRPLSAEDRRRMAYYLQPNTYVVIDDRIRGIVHDVVGDEHNPVIIARKLYDWVLKYADYWVKDPARWKASPVGSTEYCLNTRTGNCTDFHSLWTSLARAAGLPTRMVYGSLFKKELAGKDTDQSYHCWPQFWAPKLGWISHDVALADIFDDEIRLDDKNRTLVQRTTPSGYTGKDPAKVAYYFGNLDERRVTWSVGRDLALEPHPAARTVNALPKAYVEVDGKPLAEGAQGWVRKLTYTEGAVP